jgi:hypothetical protein
MALLLWDINEVYFCSLVLNGLCAVLRAVWLEP